MYLEGGDGIKTKDNDSISITRPKKKEVTNGLKEEVTSVHESPDQEEIEDIQMEKRVVIKMDVFMVSLLSFAYFLASLDKSNIGNAQLSGLSEDLKLEGNQYGNCVSVMYATYVSFEPAYANLLGVLGTKTMLCFCMFGWSLVSILTSQCKNYHHLIVCRLLLGFFESGLYPTVNMSLTLMFRRSQLARRFAYVFAASALASAFGGLISYGCTTMSGKEGLSGWQWMYIIEGSLSMVFLPMYLYFLPNHLEDAKIFDKDEKEYIIRRFETMSTYQKGERLTWRAIFDGLKDFRTVLTGSAQFCLDLTSYGLGTFMPLIVNGLGFANVEAQLLMVPIYLLTAVCFLIIALFSDRFCLRSPFAIGSCIIVSTGLAIVVGSTDMGLRFFGIFVLAIPLYTGTSLNLVWISGNTANFFKRATVLGFNQLIGNSSGVVYGQMFSTEDAPRYITGICICLGTQIYAALVFTFLLFYYKAENKKRERLIAEAERCGISLPNEVEKGDKNVYFVYGY